MRIQSGLFVQLLISACLATSQGTAVQAQDHDHAGAASPAASVAAATGGQWSDAATWVSGKAPAAGDTVSIGQGMNVVLDVSPPVLHGITLDGKPVRLSAREFALLCALLETPGKPLSRTQLEERLYGWDEEIESNAVEVHIHSLRRKLGQDWIRNLRGVGYFVPTQA